MCDNTVGARWVRGPQSLAPREGVWITALVFTVAPSFCDSSSQKSLLWQLTVLASFSLLLASRKPWRPALFLGGHSSQERKKSTEHSPLSSDLLPSCTSEKPQTCICFFSTQKKLARVTRGQSAPLIEINSVRRRESPWISRGRLAVMSSG